MLQQITFTLLAGLGISHQLFYYIQLVIARKYYLLRLAGNLLTIHQFHLGFYLQADESLQQRKQHISTQHLFPQIRSRIAIRIFRITAITYISCAVTTLIKWQEESIFALQSGCHHYLLKVHSKVSQNTVVELE